MEFTSAAGVMLASAPDMLDPNFMHTVVLMCQHSPEGAFGLVVNRKSDYVAESLLPDESTLKGMNLPVYEGGPVGLDSLQFLHRLPSEAPDGIEVFPGLFLGGKLDELVTVSRARPLHEDFRLFLGYSGWGAGQLEDELAGGSWLPVPPQMEAVFASDQEASWRKVVGSLGEEDRGPEGPSPNVSWN